MVQFEILTGKTAGKWITARRFPVRIGRAPSADLCLEDDGVWPEHLELDLAPSCDFVLTVQAPAVAAVNSLPIQHASLRNGDSVQIGSVRMRFWLSAARQSRLGWREAVTWSALGGVTAAQIALINWLSR